MLLSFFPRPRSIRLALMCLFCNPQPGQQGPPPTPVSPSPTRMANRLAFHKGSADGAYRCLWRIHFSRLRRMEAGVEEGKDTPSAGPEKARDAAQGLGCP